MVAVARLLVEHRMRLLEVEQVRLGVMVEVTHMMILEDHRVENLTVVALEVVYQEI